MFFKFSAGVHTHWLIDHKHLNFSFREEQYKHVWTELDVYVEGASTTSPMHKKVKIL